MSDTIWGQRRAGSRAMVANREHGMGGGAVVFGDGPPDRIRLPDVPELGDKRNVECRVVGVRVAQCVCGNDHAVRWMELDMPGVVVAECTITGQFFVCEIPEEEKLRNREAIEDEARKKIDLAREASQAQRERVEKQAGSVGTKWLRNETSEDKGAENDE